MREILDREENSRTTEDEWLNIQLEEPEREVEENHENRGNYSGGEPQPLAPGPSLEQRLRELEETNRQLREERDRERDHRQTQAAKSAQESNNNDDGDREDRQRNTSAPLSPADFHSIPTTPVDEMPANLGVRTTNLVNTVASAQMSATPELFVNLTDNLYLGNPNLRNARTRRTEADGAQETNSPHLATQTTSIPETQATSIPEPDEDLMDDDEIRFA